MKLSIVIPTCGRPVAVKGAIHSLLSVEPEKYGAEILVVDNNSDVLLSEDLRAYCVSLDGMVRYVSEPSPGLGAARHRGVRESKGDILTFIDDDVEVSAGWLEAIQKGFSDPEVSMVGGPSIPKFTSSVPAWFWDFFSPNPYGGWMCGWLSLLDIGQSVKGIDPTYIWGLNFSIRREVIERCGGFHPDLMPTHLQRWQGNGETGLTMKVAAAGFRADYIQEALLFHLCGPDRLNPQYFVKRAYFSGIDSSFTRIRAGQDPMPNSMPNSMPHPHLSIYRKSRALAGKVLRRLQGQGHSSVWFKEGASIKQMTDKARLEGWRFHQAEVAADPKLLAWVRRENYWDTDVRKESSHG